MNTYPYIDCQGLAGAWTLGTVQTGGFDLVHRASLGAFGDKCVDHNRALLGDFTQDTGDGSEFWEPRQAAYLNGTPPCSGFSLLNVTAAAARKAGKDKPGMARGIDSAINSCMWELIRYAARCTGSDGQPGPEVVAFESVQGAGNEGRPLMQALRTTLSELTGQRYELTHVFMSGSSVGAAQMRHRYYPVFHRIPFGVDHPDPRKVVTYRDAIGDLIGLELKWETQGVPVDRESNWMQEFGIGNEAGGFGEGQNIIGDHVTYDDAPHTTGRSIYQHDLLPYYDLGGGPGTALRRYMAEHGRTPEGAEHWWDNEKNDKRGFGGPRLINPDKPGYVLTGGGVSDFFHWEEPRYITVREAARLMGYPDAWRWDFLSSVNQASNLIGKCCPVQSGRWISSWVHAAIDGNPGTLAEPIDENERSFNCTLDYRRWPVEISQYEYTTKATAKS